MPGISVYGGLLDSVNDLEASIAQDPNLSRIYDAWLNRSVASLDNAEAARLALLVVTLFRGYEKAFFAWQYEVISDTEWSRFDRLICNGFEQTREISRTDGFASASEDLTAVLNEDFMNYITESCGE